VRHASISLSVAFVAALICLFHSLHLFASNYDATQSHSLFVSSFIATHLRLFHFGLGTSTICTASSSWTARSR
jgi:hypothetical protein